MKSAGLTATTVDLYKTNLKTTGGTVDLSRTTPKDKEKEKGKKSNGSSLKKISPYAAPTKSANSGKSKPEVQGPIDWTHMGIKLKYRGEKQREDAWEVWKSSIGNAKKLLEDFNEIIPVVKVDRHPIYSMYFRRVAEENYESNTRTKSRLLMKKFILDVQELWLANLEHLREHQAGKMTTIRDEDEDEAENYMRGSGLDHRRDVRDIAGMQHQVQSVSQKRAFAQAYHTSRMPPPKVKLDYQPAPTPTLPSPTPVVPNIESIMDSISFIRSADKKTEGQYHFMDDAAVNYTDSVSFHIDRLLPSNDFSTFIAQDIYWRITLFHSVSLSKRVFLVPETHMAMYAAQLMNADMSSASQPDSSVLAPTVVYQSQQLLPLPYFLVQQSSHDSHPQDQSSQKVVEWEGRIVIQVSQQQTTSAQLLLPIRITVWANIQPVEHIQQLYLQAMHAQQVPQELPSYQLMLQLSPQELRHLLHRNNLPLFDLTWWLDENRLSDVWEPLIPFLRLDINNASNSQFEYNFPGHYARQPQGLQIVDPQYHRRWDDTASSASKRFTTSEDMLTTLQAAACSYEVLPYLRMIVDHSSNNSTNNSNNRKVDSNNASDSETVPVIRWQSRQDPATHADILAPKLTEVQSIDTQYPYDTIGIDPSVKAKDWKAEAKTYHQTGRWEKLLEQGLNGSLLANQGLDRIYYVPGASEVGRKGLWFPDALDAQRERSQVGAVFFRDVLRSTTDSILVHLTLLLESSLIFKSETAWEGFSQLPAASIGEEVNGIIPMLTSRPRHILQDLEPLDSPIERRLSAMVTIFSSTAVEGIDYLARDYEQFVPLPQRPKGLRRYVPTKNKFGYREQIEVQLLNIDPVVDAKTFGITQQGAIANTPGVNPRNIWHNMIAVNEHICRPRTSKDYHYVVANPNHCGANIPTSYTTRMKALEMVGLTSSAFKNFEDAYAKIQELRTVFTKQLALDAKIEKVTNDLKIKEAMTVRLFQRKLQRQLERKLKKSTKSEEGWKRRFKASTLVEVQGNWERRRDDRNGLLFFHRIVPKPASTYPLQHSLMQSSTSLHLDNETAAVPENYAETCQWDIPTEWDGEFWKIHNPNYKGHLPRFAGSSADGLLSQHDTIDSQYPYHTGDTVMVQGKTYHNPVRTVPTHLQNITIEHKGQVSTQILQRQAQEHEQYQSPGQGFQEPRSDWHPAGTMTASANGSLKPPPVPALYDTSISSQRKYHLQETDFDLDSARADRSLADSIAPTIDTVNLEHIAEQLISSDEIMRVIAKRLGIPESQVIPADELSSVFSIASSQDSRMPLHTQQQHQQIGGLYAPREPINDHPLEQQQQRAGVIDYDSDEDLWSDEDEEVGDFDVVKELARDEDMPQNQLEYAQWRRRQNVDALAQNDLHHGTHSSGQQAKRKGRGHGDVASVPSQVPYLDLREVLGGETNAEVEANQRKYNWRRLPRPVIKDNFLTQSLKTHVRGPDPTSCNTLNTPIFLMPIAPVDACHYVPEPFGVAIESIFIPNAKKDMERSVATLERNIKREEELARNIPTDDLLLFGEAKEFTSVEMFLAKQYKADQAQVSDPQDAAKERALLAAKATNIAQMEDCLAEDIPINTADAFGNTLLILAAQQGSRRMCKFLLRRGANINMQNFSGNTALHYCYAYGNNNLGEYLKGKGANDAIVNADGLTCYEGLSRDAMADFYGDFEEGDYHQAGQSPADGKHLQKEESGDEEDDNQHGLYQESVSQLGDSTVGY